MSTAYDAGALKANAGVTVSELAALANIEPILSAWSRAVSPERWATMTGAMEMAGTAGIFLGPVGLPLFGTLFVIWLIVVVAGAISSRIRAGAYRSQLSLAFVLLLIAGAALIVALVQ